FASLALEVIWFRVLVLFLDVTTYAFTVMLATFLCGIAAGSYLVTPLLRAGARSSAERPPGWQFAPPRIEGLGGARRNWPFLLAIIELAIGIAAVFSLAALAHTYDVLAGIEALLPRPLPARLAPMLVASFLAIFPATLLMGIAFPIGLRIWTG